MICSDKNWPAGGARFQRDDVGTMRGLNWGRYNALDWHSKKDRAIRPANPALRCDGVGGRWLIRGLFYNQWDAGDTFVRLPGIANAIDWHNSFNCKINLIMDGGGKLLVVFCLLATLVAFVGATPSNVYPYINTPTVPTFTESINRFHSLDKISSVEFSNKPHLFW
jgi:hypothetical protein